MSRFNVVNHGTMSITGSAIGNHNEINTVLPKAAPERAARPGRPPSCDVGVITVTDKETRAVKSVLGLRGERHAGFTVYRGEADGVSVTAVRALQQGQRSAGAAVENLLHACDPGVVVLTGIGGGRTSLPIGDVVVSTAVVYYDQRKVTPGGVLRRADALTAPAAVGHAVNAFRTDVERIDVHDPAGAVRSFGVHDGPLGSGEAVIADARAAELAWLMTVNDKLLAVDMEAGGVARGCHERAARSGREQPWLVVRGISDHADEGKGDGPQPAAALHAALVLRRLLPYLAGR